MIGGPITCTMLILIIMIIMTTDFACSYCNYYKAYDTLIIIGISVPYVIIYLIVCTCIYSTT